MFPSHTATYLSLKEKSKFEVISVQSHNRLTATKVDIQHHKLPAVQICLKREAQSRRKQLREGAV